MPQSGYASCLVRSRRYDMMCKTLITKEFPPPIPDGSMLVLALEIPDISVVEISDEWVVADSVAKIPTLLTPFHTGCTPDYLINQLSLIQPDDGNDE
jgi:hypothetical protein